MIVTFNEIDRRFLVEALEELQSDEYDSSEAVYLTEEELVLQLIEAGKYWQRRCNGEEE